MKKLLLGIIAIALGFFAYKQCYGPEAEGKYAYETVENDPLNAKIYTLANGLKVYMTVNKEQPRIQANIAVRTGGKNDPAETTGLAHYLEHLMFKGTENFGTQDYASEKPLLDEITNLYEVYRTKTDEQERKALYHQIDSVSGIAAKFAIPNEYDKLMSIIGASGTNAYTSEDVTCYVEEIPSNQIENWAKIQAERFQHPVFRLFHTELEAVYEEKNMSMTQDTRKEFEALDQMLYPNHPYGQQTVIGTQEHLKNPSLINIRNYFNTWYVPNNVAICLSGDFDPDQMIDVITKYFGDWKASDAVPQNTWPTEPEITEPATREVLGQEAENIMLAWRIGGNATEAGEKMGFVSALLYNGTAGLLDLDLNQAQKVLAAQNFFYGRADDGHYIVYGMPLPGQSLDEVKDLVLAEIEKLRKGDFDESLLESVRIDYKLSLQKQLEDNDARASMFVESFVNGEDWAHSVASIERINQITKQDVIDFANQYLKDNNFVCVYKRQGDDPTIQRIEKPAITPVEANRDAVSPFLQEIQQSEVAPIEPVFVDYANDMQKLSLNHGQELLYKKNETNQLFELTYIYEMGRDADRVLPYVSSYADYLGTSDMMPDEVQTALYSLGCQMSISCGTRRFYAVLSGLDENLPAAVELLDKMLNDAQPNDDIFAVYLDQIFKQRADAKLSQGSVYGALRNYSMYGPSYIKSSVMTNAELAALKASDLTDRLHNLANLKHRVLYYGPTKAEDVATLLNQKHQTAETLADVPVNAEYPLVETSANVVNYVPYTANNSMMGKFFNAGKRYDAAMEPTVDLFNEYFGGSMNGIVFQEMRETRGLAYSAGAYYVSPSWPSDNYYMYAQITTQNDKLQDAYTHFDEIINDTPQSEPAFQNALNALQARLRTQRTSRSSVLWSYINAQDLGLTEDPSKAVFEQTQKMTLQDIMQFQQQYIKGHNYGVSLVSDPQQVDLNFFRSVGTVNQLTVDQVFGY